MPGKHPKIRFLWRSRTGCMERYESSKYLLTIPYPVCILCIVNNVHVEVIG